METTHTHLPNMDDVDFEALYNAFRSDNYIKMWNAQITHIFESSRIYVVNTVGEVEVITNISPDGKKLVDHLYKNISARIKLAYPNLKYPKDAQPIR